MPETSRRASETHVSLLLTIAAGGAVMLIPLMLIDGAITRGVVGSTTDNDGASAPDAFQVHHAAMLKSIEPRPPMLVLTPGIFTSSFSSKPQPL